MVVVWHARIVLTAHPDTVCEGGSSRDRDPVDAVLLADPARELELDQRGSDVPGTEARRPGQLVDARRVNGQALH